MSLPSSSAPILVKMTSLSVLGVMKTYGLVNGPEYIVVRLVPSYSQLTILSSTIQTRCFEVGNHWGVVSSE